MSLEPRHVASVRRRIREENGMTRGTVLSLASLGMVVYGVYSIAAGLFDLLFEHRLEFLPDAGLIVLGLLLMLAAAFVRVRMPGGLALALGALLGLQALALHNNVHWYGSVTLLPQVVRGVFAAGLALLAWLGGRPRVPGTAS
jgi:hypothetical protein